VGYQAGYSTSTGNGSVYIGQGAGFTSTATGNVFNTLVGATAGYGLTSGKNNTFIGAGSTTAGAGYYVTTGSQNVILGGYNGNQGSLDIRTANNYIVLSDGDGNPRGYFDGSGILNVPAKVLSPNLQGPTFSAYPSANQSISDSTWTKVTYDTEEYDTNSNFASSRFTPTVAGYYQVNARVVFNGFALNQTILAIRTNGTESKRLMQIPNSVSSSVCPMGSALIYLNGSTDYIEIYIFQNSGSSQSILGTYSAETYFQAVMVRS
jgi:hypothetical protein